jgi:hypothetical protein
MKRGDQVAIGKRINETWAKGSPGSPQREFKMYVNARAQAGTSRADAEALALADVRERHPGFTPQRLPVPDRILGAAPPTRDEPQNRAAALMASRPRKVGL